MEQTSTAAWIAGDARRMARMTLLLAAAGRALLAGLEARASAILGARPRSRRDRAPD